MRETVTRVELADMALEGPIVTPDGDVFRSLTGIEILLSEADNNPTLSLRRSGGSRLEIVEEDGTGMDPEESEALLWEILEDFDDVMERLSGPIPEA